MKALEHNKVNIRRTHPGFYHALMTFAVGMVAFAFNFWFSNPTFNPYDISKNLVGVVFFVLGVSLLVFLNVIRNLRRLRLMLACSVGFMFFWAVANTQQFFAGNASLQLPIAFFVICIAQYPWLVESPVNPMTKRKKP